MGFSRRSIVPAVGTALSRESTLSLPPPRHSKEAPRSTNAAVAAANAGAGSALAKALTIGVTDFAELPARFLAGVAGAMFFCEIASLQNLGLDK
jgi:hypothetical protein